MGEYAYCAGERIKLGTCENMYYLRADQKHLVSGEDAAYNFSAEGLAVIRFRFPFPDEDTIAPGAFEDHGRGVRIPGYKLPSTLSGDEHGRIQFKAHPGYLVSLPCPEQFPSDDLRVFNFDADGSAVHESDTKIHRNGWSGGPVVRQQAFRGGRLVTLCSCGSCGALHRLDTLEDAEPVIEAFRAEADATEWTRDPSDWDEDAGRWSDERHNMGHFPRYGETHRAFLLQMAARIEAGYYIRTPGEELVPA